jgi:hypothetical protein
LILPKGQITNGRTAAHYYQQENFSPTLVSGASVFPRRGINSFRFLNLPGAGKVVTRSEGFPVPFMRFSSPQMCIA